MQQRDDEKGRLIVIADVQASPPPRALPATPDPWRATPRDFHHGLLDANYCWYPLTCRCSVFLIILIWSILSCNRINP